MIEHALVVALLAGLLGAYRHGCRIGERNEARRILRELRRTRELEQLEGLRRDAGEDAEIPRR